MGFFDFIGKGLKTIGKAVYGGADALLFGGALPNLPSGSGTSAGMASTNSGTSSGTNWQDVIGQILGGQGSNGGFNAGNLAGAGLSTLSGALANRDEISRIEPNLTPDMQTLRDQLVRQGMGVYGDTAGIEARGISDINRSSDLYKQNLTETLGQRGITGPAEALSMANADANRFGEITRFKQGMPMLKAQLLNQGAGFLNGLPRGQTQTIQGNKLGGAMAELSDFILGQQGIGLGDPKGAGGGVAGKATPNAPTSGEDPNLQRIIASILPLINFKQAYGGAKS